MNNIYDNWKTTDPVLEQQTIPDELVCSHCGNKHYNKFVTIDDASCELICVTCIKKNINYITGYNEFDTITYTHDLIKPAMSLHTGTYYDNGDTDIYEKVWYYIYIDKDYKVKYYTSPTNYYKYDGLGNRVNQKLDYQILPSKNIIASVCQVKKIFNKEVVMNNIYLKINLGLVVEQ